MLPRAARGVMLVRNAVRVRAMCYSAEVQEDYRWYIRTFGAKIDIAEFVRLYTARLHDPRIRIARAMDLAFAQGGSADALRVKALIDAYDATRRAQLERDLFALRKRLADAQRALRERDTRKARESQRIATTKIAWTRAKLEELGETRLLDRHARIFPGWYAPVLTEEGGERVLRPMRYQCRPAGKPANYDKRYPGTYNARRDNLEGFWKGLFGHHHAIMVANAFFENVSAHRLEGRELAPGEPERNVVLEFKPRPRHDMLLACLYSHWSGADDAAGLYSFAAITDEPPPEIAAAGHDRCIVPIRRENLDAWLRPDPANRAAAHALLDDRDRPFYEHRLAA